MGRGRPRAVEKGVLGQNTSASPGGVLNIPQAPVYYPTEDEFKDPLEFIYKIRPEAERYGICKIVPPKCWKPPFALDLNSFTFPTKTQAIHQLQARPASCDPKTFELEYNRFLEEDCGKKAKKQRVVFEGEDLDLCKLYNSVKRFGGYDKVAKQKKWGEVFRFVRPVGKITECAKHVLSQLYLEHLYDYEEYFSKLNKLRSTKCCRRGNKNDRKRESSDSQSSSSKRRRKNSEVAKEEEVHDQICEQCRSGLHGEVMLLCDRCDKGWHIYCLSPPLKQIPLGNWYCLQCLNSEEDSFGFVPGREFSLDAFRRIADRAKKKWFGSSALTSRMQLEKKFWEIVEGSAGEVEVKYGSDLDTSIYGSGFPRVNDEKPSSVEQDTWDEYCASPWNLNNLPKLPGSMLRAVHHSIAGVMVPWLYIGMLFSSFCWHFEDHCFYSMNYHHWGEPKFWYSVPGSEAQAFEKVMRNSLPDLFDAQPDLLFQLVTMLNPRVLQENGVPVYNVLQEPGDFIITFPRSYHGGFNFGLNCAEAVNFAPADWLPHGGFGAELYQLYRKAAVLSHEELLCAVARSELGSKAAPYLKAELVRVYSREKSWRERLWKNGMINSSAMPPRMKPEYVGTEEDPTCIICQQYLYLSAVVCNCAPSSSVCLEHGEHLCECKPQKRQLLYRHTLAELNDLVLITDKSNLEEAANNFGRQLLSSNDPPALSKKVKGGCITHVQLAEEWLVKSRKLFQKLYSSDAYCHAIKESEQFMWAGHEMDPVRDLTKKLIEAQSWAENVRDCLSKVKFWMSSDRSSDAVKVTMEVVNNLLSLNPVPCDEPAHLKLKDFQTEASQLTLEIDSVLSSRSNIHVSDLETLYSKAVDCPFYMKESEDLAHKLSSIKDWVERVRKCMSETSGRVEADMLYKLEKENLSLQVQIPEAKMLVELIRQVECCQSRCREMLEASLTLKELELLLQKWDGFAVNVPELELLRQYHKDAVSWITRANHVLLGINEREDQETVVEELTCIQKDASLLRIKVEELPFVDIELKKASCRVKALKALRCKMSVDYIEQLLMEASILKIEKEKLFADVSKVKAIALSWEERARRILISKEEISEFEDVIRASGEIFVILPSLEKVKDAVSMAKSWLSRSQPFLSCDSASLGSSPSLEVETLKELVSESEFLKLTLREEAMIQTLLKTCTGWEQDARSVLHATELLLNTDNDEILSERSKIVKQIQAVNSVLEAGRGLGFKFDMVPKLQDASCTLDWCIRALSFATEIPTLEEVEMNLGIVSSLPNMYTTCSLCIALMDWLNWLKKAFEVFNQSTVRRSSLRDAAEVFKQYQKLHVSSPAVVSLLQKAIEKHNSWLDQVHLFFSLNLRDRSWDLLLQLKEKGSNDAFSCSELDMVFSEVHKVEEWKCRCGLTALLQTENSLQRSISILEKSNGTNARALCICCSLDGVNQKLLACSTCNDSFHLQCIRRSPGDANDSKVFICPYCHFVNSGGISRSGSGPLNIGRKSLKLHKLVELLSDAEDLCLWIEERDVLHQIVQKALDFKARVEETVKFVLAYRDKDLSIVAEKLCVALKAVHLVGAYDCEANKKLELALATTSWKIRAQRLLDGSQKPSIQVLQRHLKEGLAVGIPSEDYFRHRLTDVKNVGLQWADKAKKVSTDGGALGLDKVFELISEGENLVVSCEKELKSLRDRSMLYCICRRPYDERAMIACDKCDEWYHFDCIKLSSLPKVYFCPACCLEGEEFVSTSGKEKVGGGKQEVPQTPSPRQRETRRKSRWEGVDTAHVEPLLWKNRKPYRRAARKREHFESLCPFIFVQNNLIM